MAWNRWRFDVVDSLVPQLNIRLNLETFGIHGRFYLIQIENKYLAFSPSFGNEFAILFYKAASIVEIDLHALLHDLADWDQILRYRRNVQDILDAIVFAFFAKWNTAAVLNGMCGVVST